MLKLKLEPDKRFMHDALSNCKVVIQKAGSPAVEESAPGAGDGVDAVDPVKLAEGVFRLMNTGNAVDAVITAQGTMEAVMDLDKPAQLEAILTANATKKIAFAEDETTVDTHIVCASDETFTILKPVATGWEATVAQDPDADGHASGHADNKNPWTLRITRPATATKAARVDVTLGNITVATGCGDDPNCNGSFTIRNLGEIHVDAVCSWARCRDLKPNPTHFRIRAVNSHAKVYTLGISDPTETANTSGE